MDESAPGYGRKLLLRELGKPAQSIVPISDDLLNTDELTTSQPKHILTGALPSACVTLCAKRDRQTAHGHEAVQLLNRFMQKT